MNNENKGSEIRSEWGCLEGVESITVSPSINKIDGEVSVPGSKSLTNRALIISAMAEGTSNIRGILKSDDSYWCINVLDHLGIEINIEGHSAEIRGQGGYLKTDEIYIGSAGTVARFLPGFLALTDGEWVVRASNNMNKRPIGPLVDALCELGADIEYLNNEQHYPIKIKGRVLSGGKIKMSGEISSQFISGILMAAPHFTSPLKVIVEGGIVQKNYVKMTLDLMAYFGAEVEYNESLTWIQVRPSKYRRRDLKLESDVSASCYFMALSALTNGKVRINGIDCETKQPDIGMLDVFEKMGCKVIRGDSYIELEGVSQLKGGFEISMREMSDQALTLAAVAPFLDGPLTVKGVSHIRYHESDRIKVVEESMKQLNIKTEIYHDGFKIYPGKPKAARLETHDDHRVAMSLALIGTKVSGIQLKNPGCVSKTFPEYFSLLKRLGVKVEIN